MTTYEMAIVVGGMYLLWAVLSKVAEWVRVMFIAFSCRPRKTPSVVRQEPNALAKVVMKAHAPSKATASDSMHAELEQSEDSAMDIENSIMEMVANVLDANDAAYGVRADDPLIDTGFVGEQGVFGVTIGLIGDPRCLAVSIRVPLVVPEDVRLEMADLISRANYGLIIGAFEMKTSEGLIRFRSSIPIADGEVTGEQFKDLYFASLVTADRYYRAMARLMYGDDLSPAEAVAEVEMACGENA